MAMAKRTQEDDECKHLIYPAESCTMCFPRVSTRHVGSRQRDPFTAFGDENMIAEFDGSCPQCQGRIEKGLDEIVLYRGDWVHSECARD